MARRLFVHIRQQWIGVLALFVALGGTAYAATGGNFILGQANSAGGSTRLSSGTSADALKVTDTKAGRAIAGYADTNQAIYGHSNSQAGLVGESGSFDGVYGASNGAGAGVSGHNSTGGGWGVFGGATGGIGVGGYSDSGNAVEGISAAPVGSGVYGQDNNANSYGVAGHSDNGVAVAGDSSSGWAMQALGNTTQTRAKSGFGKAMVYVDFDNHPADPIRQCFNSQLPPGQATSGDCGFAARRDTCCPLGFYQLDFNFRVDDRFILGTDVTGHLGAEVDFPPNFYNDVVLIGTTFESDEPFWLVVF